MFAKRKTEHILSSHHAMYLYRGLETQLHTLLMSAQDGKELPASRLTPSKSAPLPVGHDAAWAPDSL
jgi:hypothetical protein